MDSRDLDLEPDFDKNLGIEFYSIPVDRLNEMVTEYVSKMETERTNEWCKCEWIIHPDDLEIPDGICRKCMSAMDDEVHHPSHPEYTHDHSGKRMRRGSQHPICAVHTKEGFLIGFFEWVFNDGPKR